jgi:hypothetical protein
MILFGLVFRVTHEQRPEENFWRPVTLGTRKAPLILRCRKGEQLEIIVKNKLPNIVEPEPHAPEVPLEKTRPISNQVSIHADLLDYDILNSDGANVGFNPEQTILQDGIRTYIWRVTLPPGSAPNEKMSPVLLQDMADFRNHRHHGLIGALIIEEPKATPYAVIGTNNTATSYTRSKQAWCGERATIINGGARIEEVVVLLQDGLRIFHNGDISRPLLDFPPGTPDNEKDKEDQGNKAFSYRTEPVGVFDPGPPKDILGIPYPATPVFRVPVDKLVHFHLIGANDKPRNFSFTIHGVTWPEWRFLSGSRQPRVASESAITCGSTRTFEFTPEHTGDHAYRSGMLSWAVHQGLWGILRVGAGRTSISRLRGSIPAVVALGTLLGVFLGAAISKQKRKHKG